MWLTLTQADGQKIAINFDTVKVILPTDDGTHLSFIDDGSAHVAEKFKDIVSRLDKLRDYMRGA